MRADELDYDLPPELVAQEPAPRREDARMLHVRRADGALVDRGMRDLPSLLRDDDLLVVNDSRVRPARLHGHVPTGGRVELLVLAPAGDGAWRCLARPARRLRPGTVVDVAGHLLEVVDNEGQGRVVVRGPVEDACEEAGEMPVPPYVRRRLADPTRYQTLYAAEVGSAAAPTAGLHLGEELWPELERRHEVVRVTLHVGLGTFTRVSAPSLADHVMHDEAYRVAPADASRLAAAHAARRRLVCVGTTAVRVVETLARGGPPAGRTRLMLTPDDPPRWVGALLTNFHEPRTTLVALVMSFAGHDLVRRAYAHAVSQRYRFLSLGDASFWE